MSCFSHPFFVVVVESHHRDMPMFLAVMVAKGWEVAKK